MSNTFDELFAVIQERQENPTNESYTASLLESGIGKIAQKLGEEAVEVVVSALSESDERLLSEMADLSFHLFVLLAARGLDLSDLERELASRFPRK